MVVTTWGAQFDGPSFSSVRLFLMRFFARLHGPLEVLEIVEEDSLESANCGIDVAGQSEIDEDKLAGGSLIFSAAGTAVVWAVSRNGQTPHVFRGKNIFLRRGGADNEIGGREAMPTLRKCARAKDRRLGAQLKDQFLSRAVIVAEDKDRLRTALRQFSGRTFSHVAGAEDDNVFSCQRAEDLFRKARGSERSGEKMRSELGFLAHATTDGEATAQNIIEMTSGATRIARMLPGERKLAGDVAFADVHGVKTATNAEGMDERLLIEETIEGVPLLKLEVVLGGKEAQDGIDGEGRITPEDKLGAVRGREDDGLVDALGLRKHGENFRLTASAHPETFANFDGRRFVIQADYNQRRFQETRSLVALWH